MLPSAIIVDLDGTLTSCEHRRKFVTNGNKNWRDFNFNIPFDAPVPWVRRVVVDAMWSDVAVLFTSGRGEQSRYDTEQWLYENVITNELLALRKPWKLLMRAHGDFRKDDVVKRELYDDHIAGQYDVEFVIDDRWMVIQMWESLGLFVIRVTDPGLEPLS
jgi:hypothetical protein